MHMSNLTKRFRFKLANSNCRFSTNECDSELKFCNIAQPTFMQELPEFPSGIKVLLRFQTTL